MKSSKEIRQLWLDFFVKNDHKIVETKSLVPQNDPSLLWINSGVATLKDFFSGKRKPPHPRLTNSQKAIRTNDIENVGITSRHHTMFEMLGNFSIGDYFKKEAIEMAYDFLINYLNLDISRIYITYFGEDLETKQYWKNLGIKEEHIIAGSRKTNFWDMGQGPCGPCSEIFYDRGEKFDSRGIELLKEDIENDRYIEIWNIVFSQFNNDGKNNYTELAQKNIDTGAGLERIVSILQDAPTNFDTDLFIPIINAIEEMTDFKYDPNNYFTKNADQKLINTYFKIIADHIRAAINAINDGVKPSNVSRGYIIRRLIRRAYRSGKKLNIKQKTFLYKLVDVVKKSLVFDIDVAQVSQIIKEEEEFFSETIDQGQKLLEKEIAKNPHNLDFEVAFKMYETYGFPIELTQEILKEKNIDLDINLFDDYLKKHADKSRGNKKVAMQKAINSLSLVKTKISKFIGYDNLQTKAKILFLANTEKTVDEIEGKAFLILDKTTFYATGGGQKHDQGYLLQKDNKIEILEVFKDKHGNNIHVVKGKINFKDEVECFVNPQNRTKLEINHSSTHLLFKALREIYGSTIEQLGSDNNEERLTFDFPLDHKPTEKEIKQIENLVREYIKQSANRNYLETDLKKARELNAIMTLEETEYMDPNNVRLVEFENITIDLCGGTHIYNSKGIENFKIVNVENKGVGIYRIRAITTNQLINKFLLEKNKEQVEILQKIVDKNQALDNNYKLELTLTQNLEKNLEILTNNINEAREINKKLLKQKTQVKTDDLEITFEKIGNFDVYINCNFPVETLKIIAAELREKYPQNIFVLGSQSQKQLLVISSKVLDSNQLLKNIFSKVNGKGGGSAIIAQGSCDLNDNILNIVKEAIKNYV
ncbi:alanine--tRNA ligase [Mycoplasma iguanae]|uniref:Alanine--tRNA ligase n=1 Tax=Mycoplasma iguanae TaxID=292461 RepID=A0ABY5RA32_9MOLU|nr:alanine--tRNA ligase [Mycoplasma iguanae]UVD81639.1 alanine--tRNA ligase [Mycoplasma iguanae]